jgi:hypothetical protein
VHSFGTITVDFRRLRHNTGNFPKNRFLAH